MVYLTLTLTWFNSHGTKWHQGNFNNHTDDVTDDGDLNIILANFNRTVTIGGVRRFAQR